MKVATIDNSSRLAPAELVRMVFNVSPGDRSARQFEGFVYVDGQLGREPGRYQVQLSERNADVSKWGRICNLLRHGKGTV